MENSFNNLNLEESFKAFLFELQKGIIEVRDLQKLTEIQVAKTEAQLAKTDAQLAKTNKKLAETSSILSNIGINLGHVAEEFFYYSLRKHKRFGNIQFDQIELNVHARNKKAEGEFDIVMYNGNSIALLEIKHKAHPTDIEKLKTTQIEKFKLLFPDYADYKFYLGIGGMSVPEDIEDLAHQNGIAVLRQQGELAIIDDKNLIAY